MTDANDNGASDTYNSLMNTSPQSSHRGFHQIINGRDMR